MSLPFRPLSAEEPAAILRLHHVEGWPVGTIADQLQRHDTVERVLVHGGLPVDKQVARSRLVDPFLPFIHETLAKYPRLRASRLWGMLRARGYTGSKSGFRAIVSRLRPRAKAEAYLRRAVLPGEEAQVDWAHFGRITVGRPQRELFAFVMVMAYSRLRFVSFSIGAAMPSFLRGHVESFRFFNAVPRVILYDNLKSAVLEPACPPYGDGSMGFDTDEAAAIANAVRSTTLFSAAPPIAAGTRWLSIQVVADILGLTPAALRKSHDRPAVRAADGGIEAELDGVRGRKLGRLWRVALSPAWAFPPHPRTR